MTAGMVSPVFTMPKAFGFEAATQRNSNATRICENLITTLQTPTYITIKMVRKAVA